MEFIYRFPPDTSRFELSNRSRRISLRREHMNWIRTEQRRSHRTVSQRIGLQLLTLLLFFYFSYSGASELGILSGVASKFEGHFWFGRVMGVTELLGGLALLRQEGALGGACFLIVAMACAVVFTILNRQIYSAVECLLMLNICIGIAHWCRSQTMEHS